MNNNACYLNDVLIYLCSGTIRYRFSDHLINHQHYVYAQAISPQIKKILKQYINILDICNIVCEY